MSFFEGLIPAFELSPLTAFALNYCIAAIPIIILVYVELSARFSVRAPKGCRKLGLHHYSNLRDEHSYNQHGTKNSSGGSNKDVKPRVKALIAYPIKSCGGIEFNLANVVETGLAYDRQFLFAEYIESPASKDDEKPAVGRWDCRTLRDGKYSRLTLIRPEIWVPDPSSSTYSPKLKEVESGGVLRIKYPRVPKNAFINLGMKLGLCSREEQFDVPMHPPSSTDPAYPRTPLKMLSRPLHGIHYKNSLPESLSTFLETTKPIGLFRVDTEQNRPVGGNAPSESDLGFQPITGFPDEYPLQMQNLSSVRNIAEQTSYAIPKLSVRRFRPNIVMEGAEAFVEDHWKLIRLVPSNNKDEKAGSGVNVHVSCRTIRCRLPNVDPDTGERHLVEPDKTVKSTRCIDPGDKKNGCLGMMLVPASQSMYPPEVDCLSLDLT